MKLFKSTKIEAGIYEVTETDTGIFFCNLFNTAPRTWEVTSLDGETMDTYTTKREALAALEEMGYA